MAHWRTSLREHAHLRRWLCILNILMLVLLIIAALLVYTGYISPWDNHGDGPNLTAYSSAVFPRQSACSPRL